MPGKKPDRRAYPTDLTDTQWAPIALPVPEAEPGGRPGKATSRELVNAILSPGPGRRGGSLRTSSRSGRRSTPICGAGSARGFGIGPTTQFLSGVLYNL
jgi:transposase